MKIKIAIVSLVAVVLAAGGIAYAGSQVPFKASGTVGITDSTVWGVVNGALVVRNEFEGTATATQLGRCTVEGVQFFPVALVDIVPGTVTTGTCTQTETFTAANGDELEVEAEGSFLIYVLPGPFFVPISGSGLMTFTGGTGRFSGATGTAKTTEGVDDDFNITTKAIGTISSLGSRGGNGKK